MLKPAHSHPLVTPSWVSRRSETTRFRSTPPPPAPSSTRRGRQEEPLPAYAHHHGFVSPGSPIRPQFCCDQLPGSLRLEIERSLDVEAKQDYLLWMGRMD